MQTGFRAAVEPLIISAVVPVLPLSSNQFLKVIAFSTMLVATMIPKFFWVVLRCTISFMSTELYKSEHGARLE